MESYPPKHCSEMQLGGKMDEKEPSRGENNGENV